jgi:hypothetical protein
MEHERLLEEHASLPLHSGFPRLDYVLFTEDWMTSSCYLHYNIDPGEEICNILGCSLPSTLFSP